MPSPTRSARTAEHDPSDDLSQRRRRREARDCPSRGATGHPRPRTRSALDATVSETIDAAREYGGRVRLVASPSATATSTHSRRKCSTAPTRNGNGAHNVVEVRTAWPVRSPGQCAPAVVPPRRHPADTIAATRTLGRARPASYHAGARCRFTSRPNGPARPTTPAGLPPFPRCENAARDSIEPSAITLTCLGPLVPSTIESLAAEPRRDRPSTVAVALPEWLPFDGTPTLAGLRLPHSSKPPSLRVDWRRRAWVAMPSRTRRCPSRTAWCHGHQRRARLQPRRPWLCSTGNLANAVAAHAARAAKRRGSSFPRSEPAKVLATAIFAPKLVRVRGTYDDVNRLARRSRTPSAGAVNVNSRILRRLKTIAFEIIE
jgi:hypothetical protein